MAEFLIRRFGDEGWEEAEDVVAGEEPLQITLDGVPVAVVMRTAGDDGDLVRGFLVTENLVKSLEEVGRVDLEAKENHALVFLKEGVEFDAGRLQRNLFSASSCGICGKASIDSIRQEYGRVGAGFEVAKDVLFAMPERLRGVQRVFAETGGLHAAALVSAAGEVLVLREDVGRHNAIDKVIGWGLAGGVEFGEVFLQVSGRVSFEVMQKALAVGIPLVAAISAPTSLAVEFARESGQTLVGFLREPRMNVYSFSERVLG
ncbi:MAG: formate dehydrogenase accessory sulfurtransferase FdhD [Verrucomicrobiota bacterium]